MASLSVELNAVVLHLRQPSSSFAERKAKLGAVAYHLPLIKNKQNLWLVLQELAVSPDLMAGSGFEQLQLTLYLVDGVHYAYERKHQVSSPTISPQEWESEIFKTAYHLPPLFGLILSSGFVNANANRVADLLRFLPVVCESPVLLPLAAGCLMRAQWSYRFTNEVFLGLPFAFELLDVVVRELFYTQANLDLAGPAVTVEIGGWSRLIAGLLLQQPSMVLFRYLQVVQIYVRTVMAMRDDPEYLKQFFFGVMIQLEGVASQTLATKRIDAAQRTQLATLVLQVLQPFGFVLEHLGAQFESYQFVLNTCLDTLSSAPAAVSAVRALGEHWSFGRLVGSPQDAGDLTFFFEVCEQLMPVMTPEDAKQLILPIVERFIKHCDHVPVFESAHSVMLAYLATHPSFRLAKADVAQRYFFEVMALFPAKLSAAQFRTAVGAVMRAVGEDVRGLFLAELFQAAKRSIPGTPLPASVPAGPHEGKDQPPTLRAALVSAFLHAAADNCDATDLARWLHLVSPMVPAPYSAMAQQEREFLVQDFSDVVTSLGSDTSDVGIRWYFKEGWSTAKM